MIKTVPNPYQNILEKSLEKLRIITYILELQHKI